MPELEEELLLDEEELLEEELEDELDELELLDEPPDAASPPQPTTNKQLSNTTQTEEMLFIVIFIGFTRFCFFKLGRTRTASGELNFGFTAFRSVHPKIASVQQPLHSV